MQKAGFLMTRLILFHVKVCVGAMLSFQKRNLKSDYITNKHVVASFDYFLKRTSYYYGVMGFGV